MKTCGAIGPRAGMVCERQKGHEKSKLFSPAVHSNITHGLHWTDEPVEGLRTRRVYIAGPITGIPMSNFPAFDAARDRWAEAGWAALSPADITRKYWRDRFGTEFDPSSPSDPRMCVGGDIYPELLRLDFKALSSAEAIALLPGWERSHGVSIELPYALALGMPVYDAAQPGQLLPPENIAAEAQRLVLGARQKDYGHPIDNYTMVGRMWGAFLGLPDIDPRKAAHMMSLAKIAREGNAYKRDNLVDLIGYALVAQMIVDRQREKKDES